MNKYAMVAVKTVSYISVNGGNPVDIWVKSAEEVFGDKISSIKKGCPKGAFLGLCEEGLVKNIKKGNYTNAIKNKEYAVEAVEILKENNHLVNSPNIIWEMTVGREKAHNSQMDIVCELWKRNLIEY